MAIESRRRDDSFPFSVGYFFDHRCNVTTLLAVVLASPWVVLPVATILRARHSRSLDDESAAAPADAPRVSVVIPARNEAHNIERCVRSALATEYPRLEVVAVDDHSTDGTGAILARISDGDARLRVVTPEPLPADWFGKQWACTAGANASTGDVIAFFDADTEQAPDLIPRAVNAMRSRDADLLTVAGDQELGSFWERVIQPQVFAVMLTRYGGTETVNASRHASDKIANGQCIFVRRSAYEATGGHAAVKDKVAEDLAMAQRYFRTGHRAFLVLGLDQLSTRMYTSLRELIDGWGKNLFAGGRDSVPGGAVGRSLAPLLLCSPWIGALVPPIVLVLSLAGTFGYGALVWSSIATGATLLWWVGVYTLLRRSPLFALLYPLGALMMLYISLGAIIRGRRVRWKDREYISA
jgi:chlorobactene glucosyltransferase